MNSRVIALFPEASYGAALNCVGIAQQLRKLGARPVFICHPGFSGVFAEYGFPEYPLHIHAQESPEQAGDWRAFVERHREAFRLSAYEQVDSYVVPTWNAIVDSAIRIEDALRNLLARLRPAAIVVDNVISFPAVLNAGVPWVRVISCAETELPDPDIPPHLSGAALSDRMGWQRFQQHYLEKVSPVHERFQAFMRSCGVAGHKPGEFMLASPWLNLLLAPTLVRYQRSQALDPQHYRFLNGCVREEVPARLPRFAAHQDAPLVYTSFGSLGAVDTELMQRMIRVFSELPYRFLVNVGSLREHYSATPDNVYLDSWFPQPSVVAQAQLFIHHGGNNSFCEALYYGVPSLVMPYCWDGHDNAQRATETGVGRRLPRYGWSDDELKRTITDLLDNQAMRARLQANAAQMQADQGTQVAARAILELL